MSEDKTSTRAMVRPTRRAKTKRPAGKRAEAPRAAARPAAAPRPAAPKTPRRTPTPGRQPTGAPARAPREKAAPQAPLDAARDFASRHRAPLIAVAAALVAVVALYGPACSLYQAWRDNGMLVAQQAQTSEESAQLEGDISSLMTEDGIKDEARERGYVESGETRIVVEGLNTDDGDSADEGDAPSGTPWYLRVTDFIFQYQAQDAQS